MRTPQFPNAFRRASRRAADPGGGSCRNRARGRRSPGGACEPSILWHQRRPLRRGRHLRPERVGGRQHPRRWSRQEDAHPAVERHLLEAGAQPGPAGSYLYGVAATSARNAWAVGAARSGKTLILHWNGTAWKRAPSPSSGAFASLSSVAATSARSAWAVGEAGSKVSGKTLILRWNGTTWKRVPSPSPGLSILQGVAATSASNAWAVGYASRTGKPTKTLILRWNGTLWR